MKRLIIASLLLLGSCNHPQPGVIVKEIPTPIPMPCLDAEDIPPEPAQVADQLTGNAASDLVIVAASALELRAAVITMRSALLACAEGSE